jgi:hypothetical protein
MRHPGEDVMVSLIFAIVESTRQNNDFLLANDQNPYRQIRGEREITHNSLSPSFCVPNVLVLSGQGSPTLPIHIMSSIPAKTESVEFVSSASRNISKAALATVPSSVSEDLFSSHSLLLNFGVSVSRDPAVIIQLAVRRIEVISARGSGSFEDWNLTWGYECTLSLSPSHNQGALNHAFVSSSLTYCSTRQKIVRSFASLRLEKAMAESREKQHERS